jgi:hypothetical protein
VKLVDQNCSREVNDRATTATTNGDILMNYNTSFCKTFAAAKMMKEMQRQDLHKQSSATIFKKALKLDYMIPEYLPYTEQNMTQHIDR